MTITLVMGLVITVLDVLQSTEPTLSILAFVPGLASIAALTASGLNRSDLYLRQGKASPQGLAALAVATLLLLPILGSSTGWIG